MDKIEEHDSELHAILETPFYNHPIKKLFKYFTSLTYVVWFSIRSTTPNETLRWVRLHGKKRSRIKEDESVVPSAVTSEPSVQLLYSEAL